MVPDSAISRCNFRFRISMDHLRMNHVVHYCVLRAGDPNGFPKEKSWLKLFGPKFWALINNDGLTTTQ